MLPPRPLHRLYRPLQHASIPSRHSIIPSPQHPSIPLHVQHRDRPQRHPRTKIKDGEVHSSSLYPSACDRITASQHGHHLPCVPQLLPRSRNIAFSTRVDRFASSSTEDTPPVGAYNLAKSSFNSNTTRRGRTSTPILHQEHQRKLQTVPSPTRYHINTPTKQTKSAAEAVFKSRTNRFPNIRKDAPFCWTYNVKVDLLHPTAPRTSSLRYTGPRLRQMTKQSEDEFSDSMLADLTKPYATKPYTQRIPHKPRIGSNVVIRKNNNDQSSSNLVMFRSATAVPGPGSYDLGKYSSFGRHDTPATVTTMSKLKRVQEMNVKRRKKVIPKILPVCPTLPPAKSYYTRQTFLKRSFHYHEGASHQWL